MSNLPQLFSDLALILVTAGITTIVFKWLKQPLVLGYIVAGFLIGPYFTYFPVIKDTTSVGVWSEIGMVFLLFALGLEFSFKKLKKVGGTGAITAFTELIIMSIVGYVTGKLLGWSQMNCIFLGCMLSISSTTIIVKAFDDLKLKKEKFSGTVIGVLVVEDLVAVLLMVILSTLAVSKQFDGRELVYSLVKLVFFLIVWFVFGIYLIPSILRWMRKLMTEETLTIVAIGLCFLMVVFANYAGFSSALGAFIMGSILAETIEAEAIHKIISPIKNLFGAVFFVSVGMMVNPSILIEYAVPILIIATIVIIIKSFSATTGIIISGQDPKTAIQSGFCFCQIGEFSFILAALGLSFGITDDFLYPIIVSVSILTTFVTPYMIKASLPFYNKVYPHIPERWRVALEQYSSIDRSGNENFSAKKFLKVQLKNLLLYCAILAALIILSFSFLHPFIQKEIPGLWGNIIGLTLTLIALAPFLWAMAFKHHFKKNVKTLLIDEKINHGIVFSVLLFRYIIALFAISMVIGHYIRAAYGVLIGVTVFVIIFLIFSRQVMHFYQRIEKQFMKNLNQRQAQNSFVVPESMQHNFHLEKMVLNPDCPYCGKKLKDTDFRQKFHSSIISIERGNSVIDLPSKDVQLFPYDKVSIVGTDENLSNLKLVLEMESETYIKERKESCMDLYGLNITPSSEFYGLTLFESNFLESYHAMVIAIERNGTFILNPSASTQFMYGDVVWFAAHKESAQLIINNNELQKHNTIRTHAG